MTRPIAQRPSPEWLKPAGTVFGALALIVGLAIMAGKLDSSINSVLDLIDRPGVLIGSDPGDQPHLNFITGLTLIGGAIGLIGVAWGWFDPARPGAAMKGGVFYGMGAALTAFVGYFILDLGMHQIGGFDHGLLVDTAWRLTHGQKAYVDFPCVEPVGWVLGAKFAFQWFGLYWKSNIIFYALYSMLTFAASLFMLGRLFGRNVSTLLWALALHAICPMLAAFWWYNPVTAMAAVVYALAAAYWLHCPREKPSLFIYGAALILMASMKPNVAGILVPGISIVLFLSPVHRWKVLWVSLVAFALFVAVLWANQMTLSEVIGSYLSVAERGASSAQFLQDISSLCKRLALAAMASLVIPVVLALCPNRKSLLTGPLIPILAGLIGLFIYHHSNTRSKLGGMASYILPVFLALVLGFKQLRPRGSWIAILALLGGLYGFTTDGELKLVDLPLVLCAVLLLTAEVRSPAPAADGPAFAMPLWFNRYFCLICLVLGGAGLAQGIVRDRVRVIGYHIFFEFDDSAHVEIEGFFKGVHCGPIFDELLKEIAAAMAREPSSTVWFGPRMQWGYAAFDKPSPLHEPITWYPGVMFAKKDEDLFFNTFLQRKWGLVFLWKNDLTYYTQDQVQRMVQQYDVDQSFPLLTLLHLKKGLQ